MNIQIEGRKLTRNQSMVLTTLNKAHAPLSAYTILDELRDEGFRAPLQVYRALEKLIAIGLVHRLESLNAFVACQHPASDDHDSTAFAICDTCGHVAEIADQDLGVQLDTLALTEGFQVRSSALELRGTCANCTRQV